MAQTGEVLTYGELEARSNRLAHLLRARGLNRLDHYAIFMENNAHYVECCSAGARTGIYYTCVNSFLTPEELAYIVNNSKSQILITSEAKRSVAAAALKSCPKIELCLIVDGNGRRRAGAKSRSSDSGVSRHAGCRRVARNRDALFLRHHRRPKGILRPLPLQPPSQQLPLYAFLDKLWRYREGMIYLSPAPLYHSAPQAAVSLTIDRGGTAIIMETFDAERVSAARATLQGDAQPARADHVLAHAQAAGSRAATLRSVLARDRGPCRRAMSGAGEGSR